MSRHMRQVTIDPPIWRGVVRFWTGREERYGPYPTKGGATQAINRALKEDNERKSCTYGPDPDAPAEQTWRRVRIENPAWEPAEWWHEKTDTWERVPKPGEKGSDLPVITWPSYS